MTRHCWVLGYLEMSVYWNENFLKTATLPFQCILINYGHRSFLLRHYVCCILSLDQTLSLCFISKWSLINDVYGTHGDPSFSQLKRYRWYTKAQDFSFRFFTRFCVLIRSLFHARYLSNSRSRHHRWSHYTRAGVLVRRSARHMRSSLSMLRELCG